VGEIALPGVAPILMVAKVGAESVEVKSAGEVTLELVHSDPNPIRSKIAKEITKHLRVRFRRLNGFVLCQSNWKSGKGNKSLKPVSN
jgi:hypothetical protein